jgi:hypothetical protein
MFKRKIPQSPKQNRADINGAPIFAPYYTATVLMGIMFDNPLEHSI